MSMDMSIKNINGTVTKPMASAEKAEAANDLPPAGTEAVDPKGKAVGQVMNVPGLSADTSVDYVKLVDILGQQVRNSRTDLLHNNLACAMTVLVNNGQIESEYLTNIAKATDELIGLEKRLVDEGIKYDTIIQGIQVEIEKLTDQINKEKDPDRKKELQAQLDDANDRLREANDTKGKVIGEINAAIVDTQKTIDGLFVSFVSVHESQKLAFASAIGTVTYVAKQRVFARRSEDAEQTKATLDGLESLALHLDKLQPGFRQACESAENLADEILGNRRSFM